VEIPVYSRSELVEKLREVNRIISKLNKALALLDRARRRLFRVVVEELGEREFMESIDYYVYRIERTLDELVEKLVDVKVKPYIDKYTSREEYRDEVLVKRLGVVRIRETGNLAVICTDGVEVYYYEIETPTKPPP
jgi:hypothetical protein